MEGMQLWAWPCTPAPPSREGSGDVQRDVQRSLLPSDRAEMTRGPVCVGGTGRKTNL